MIQRFLPGCLSPVAFFLAGIAVGLVIGWWIWPISWTNARPVDLAQGYREDYLALVADSYAQNNNLEMVRLRLQGFDLSQTANGLEDLAQKSDKVGLTDQAARMRRLQTAIRNGQLALGNPAGASSAQPQVATALPAATPAASASGGLAGLVRPLFVGLGVGLLLALAGWLVYQRIGQGRPLGAPPGGSGSQAPLPQQTAGRPFVPQAPEAGGAEAPPVYVDINNTVRISYSAEDPNYRADLRVVDASHQMVGQAELRVAEILPRAADGATPALELRLYDRRDRRTISRVLVGRRTSEDPTARQLIDSLGSEVIKPAFPISRIGQLIVLETHWLHLEAEVVDVEFEEVGAYPAFRTLVLDVTPLATETTQTHPSAPGDEEPEEGGADQEPTPPRAS